MAIHYRNPYFRISKNGRPHRVRGHDVRQPDGGLPLFERFRGSPKSQPAHSPRFGRAVAAALTIPNANCPVCSARVFFFHNSFGSRVFFDSLGPPWPKHPCMDGPDRIGGSERYAVRSHKTISRRASQLELFSFRNSRGESLKTLHVAGQARENGEGWNLYSVRRMMRRHSRIFYVVRSALDDRERSVRFSMAAQPAYPRLGDAVCLNGSRLSFFDLETFSPSEIVIRLKTTKVSSIRRRRKRKPKCIISAAPSQHADGQHSPLSIDQGNLK